MARVELKKKQPLNLPKKVSAAFSRKKIYLSEVKQERTDFVNLYSMDDYHSVRSNLLPA